MRKCGAEAGKESCTIVNMVCIRLMCLKKFSLPFALQLGKCYRKRVTFSVISPKKLIAGNLCF